MRLQSFAGSPEKPLLAQLVHHAQQRLERTVAWHLAGLRTFNAQTCHCLATASPLARFAVASSSSDVARSGSRLSSRFGSSKNAANRAVNIASASSNDSLWRTGFGSTFSAAEILAADAPEWVRIATLLPYLPVAFLMARCSMPSDMRKMAFGVRSFGLYEKAETPT